MANLRAVEGASGDKGVDSFQGDLDDSPAIWQAKAFPNGVGKSQRNQIRESLKTAINNFHPRRWVLCINVDMDVHAHSWFQKLTKSRKSDVEVGIMQGSDIVSELAHRKAISELFFPGAIPSASDLRALIMRTSDLDDVQAAKIAQENSEQLIERLKGRDARFDYEVVVSSDRAPTKQNARGAVFSLSSGPTTINAFPRDIEALRLDPPKLSFTLSATGLEKLATFENTGRPQTLEAEDLQNLSSSLPVLDVFGVPSDSRKLTLGPSEWLRQRVVPLRLTFGTGPQQVTYDYVPFRFIRAGKEEAELAMVEGSEPFSMNIVLLSKACKVTFTERVHSFSFKAANKYVRAVSAIQETQYVEAYHLQDSAMVFAGKLDNNLASSYLAKFRDFFSDAAAICERFKVDLHYNRPPTEDDAQSFELLRGIITGEVRHVDRFPGTVSKGEADEVLLARALNGEPSDIELGNPGSRLSLFDTTVDTGPFRIRSKVRLADRERIRREWDSAAAGTTIQLEWEPVGPVIVEPLPS
jgi:hypothetical protein